MLIPKPAPTLSLHDWTWHLCSLNLPQKTDYRQAEATRLSCPHFLLCCQNPDFKTHSALCSTLVSQDRHSLPVPQYPQAWLASGHFRPSANARLRAGMSNPWQQRVLKIWQQSWESVLIASQGPGAQPGSCAACKWRGARPGLLLATIHDHGGSWPWMPKLWGRMGTTPSFWWRYCATGLKNTEAHSTSRLCRLWFNVFYCLSHFKLNFVICILRLTGPSIAFFNS